MSQALRSLSLVVALQAFWLATPTCAFTFETRADCDAADAGTTDETYAPSYVSTLIAQDAFSRYLVGKISWADPYYFSYYNKRLAGDGYGFEIEKHFYNYDDAAAIGLGPAYMRGWTCESDNTMVSVACNTFQAPYRAGAHATFRRAISTLSSSAPAIASASTLSPYWLSARTMHPR